MKNWQIVGTEKQIKWAMDIRNCFVAAMTKKQVRWETMLETAKTDPKTKAELDKLLNPNASFWINNRNSSIFGVCPLEVSL